MNMTQTRTETDWLTRGQQSVMNTYARFPITLARGEGCRVWDTDGRQYLDFVSGIAVNALGHAHPALVEAVSAQCATLMHCSNLYWNTPQIELAEILTRSGGFERAFFCNSGAEAVESALKLARRYSDRKYGPGRATVIAMENSFHGRTYGAMSLTGQSKYHAGYAPLTPGIVHAPLNDLSALSAALNETVCAVIIEPIQGEGGIRAADPEYLQAVRTLCNERDILLIFDEVQTGIGRTGRLFGFEWSGVHPDIIALAKGLGGGFPIGAILANGKAAPAFQPGDHASTFGGNPLACTAGKVVLDHLLNRGLLEQVAMTGAYLSERLKDLKTRFPEKISDLRGLGLMQGIEIRGETAPIIERCMQAGLLLVGAGAGVIRFVPPLVVQTAEIDEALEILSMALSG